jgi:hypothetical protein
VDKTATKESKASPIIKKAETEKQSSAPQPNQPVQQTKVNSSTPLPPTRCQDQQIDAQYNRLVYRTGEIVWFHRGTAWGLGLVIQRYVAANTVVGEVRSYIIQQISHPYSHSGAQTITEESKLRPWLSWSPPSYTRKDLNERPQSYKEVNWLGMIRGEYGQVNAEVDASISASRAVDGSYTPLDLVKKTSGNDNLEDLHWNCLFLGGEKIWIGDTIRIRVEPPTKVVVVVLDIIERLNPTNNASSMFIIGDLYSLSKMDPPTNDPPIDQNMPLRMREDLQWRNNKTSAAKNFKSYWRLLGTRTQFPLKQIAGRWYESGFLLPVMFPGDQLDKELQGQDDLPDPNTFVNARGDASHVDTLERFKDRKAAFGASIPADTMIKLNGTEPPQTADTNVRAPSLIQSNASHQQGTAHMPEQVQNIHIDSEHYQDASTGNLDEFMNLDESVPDYSHSHVFDGRSGNQYGF